MGAAEEHREPVKAKAILVDPASMTVQWMNESALQDAGADGFEPGADLKAAMPMAEMLGVLEALPWVVESRAARHLHTSLVSTKKGSLAIATSIYPLPTGDILILTEHMWQPDESKPTTPRRPARRSR